MTGYGKNDIVIAGMSAVIPNGPVTSLIGAEPFNPANTSVSRKLQRYCPQSALWAVEAGERAMQMAAVAPGDAHLRWGFYTGQNGYQHPDFSDLEPAFVDAGINGPEEILPRLWGSRKINPFLVTHALSNNLLGVLSMHWALRGDCGAFIRDEAGVASALQEAVFSLRNGVCDIALVVNAGSQSDWVSRDLAATSTQPLPKLEEPCVGACALVLERREHTEKRGARALARLTLLPARYQKAGQSLDWLFESAPVTGAGLLVHELNAGAECCAVLRDEIGIRLQPQENIDLFARQPHKGCEGLAFNILVAAQWISKTTVTHQQHRFQRSLAIACGQDGHVSAAMVEGE